LKPELKAGQGDNRRQFVGGSDARIIMGVDEAELIRLWQEKRGEAEPEDLSRSLVVQLGKATEQLNREWFQTATGQQVIDVQKHLRHPDLHWMGATLDGRVEASGAVFESKFMLPWSFSEEAAARKYAAQLQHNMFVVAARTAVLSIITGGGRWVEITTHADPLYQHLVVTAERKFWRCVETGEPPALFGVDPPKPRIEAVRIVDMTSSNAWAEFAGIFVRTRDAHQEHERAKKELKVLVPEDAQQAIGHGIRAKRSKSGAVSLDLLTADGDDAAGK
jgi:predicted phage-related endonuclease